MQRRLLTISTMSLALAACGDMPKTWRQSEIEEIATIKAEDFADAGSAGVADEMAGRIDLLEQRIDDLERENQGHEAMIDELYANQRNMAEHVNRMNGL